MPAGVIGPRGRITEILVASYTLKDADNRNTLVFNFGTAITATIPQGLQIGWTANIVVQGAGDVTFSTATGVTLNNLNGASGVAGQYAEGKLTAVQQNVFDLSLITAASAVTIPTADIIGGNGSAFTSVTVGAGLILTAGTLTVAVPTIRDVASGTADTLLITDHGNAVSYHSSDGSVTVSVPALGAGFTCLLLQTGADAFTVVGSGGVTVENRQSQLDSAGDNAQCSIFLDTAAHAIFGGDTA